MTISKPSTPVVARALDMVPKYESPVVVTLPDAQSAVMVYCLLRLVKARARPLSQSMTAL